MSRSEQCMKGSLLGDNHYAYRPVATAGKGELARGEGAPVIGSTANLEMVLSILLTNSC